MAWLTLETESTDDNSEKEKEPAYRPECPMLSVRQISELTGLTKQAIIARAKSEAWESEERICQGGKRSVYRLDSISGDIRDMYYQTKIWADTGESVSEYAQRNRIFTDMRTLRESADKIDCYRRLESAPKGTRTNVARGLAKKYEVTLATVWRWRKAIANLKEKPCSDVLLKGSRVRLPHTRKFDTEAVRYGISVYVAHQQNGIRPAYEKMREKAYEEGWRIGDYSNFTRLIKKLPREILTIGEKGFDGFRNSDAFKLRRDWLQVPVYTVLCGDQKVNDYYTIDLHTGRVYAMNWYIFMDCTSTFWSGVYPAFGPYNRYTFGAALREACRIAIPDEIYVDQGGPENSGYAGQIQKRLSQLGQLVRLSDYDEFATIYGGFSDVGKHVAKTGNPSAKPIENQMNIFERELRRRFVAGFRKKDADSWINKQRNAELRKLRMSGQLLSTEEWMEIILDVVESHNTNFGSRQGHEGKFSPAHVLLSGLQGRFTVPDDVLEQLFMPVFERVLHQREVRVKVAKDDIRRFFVKDPFVRNGTKVRVAVDPFDIEKPAIISTLEDEIICHAPAVPFLNPASDEAELKRQQRFQKQYNTFWREAYRGMIDRQIGESVRRVGVPNAASESSGHAADVIDLDRGQKHAASTLEKIWQDA